ncbi:hypothetical protein K439DRAFT_487168 [Ramaria rubella]|nr:hypothetical protein K439DRAFT_487168 [Ramaria rubella]
MEGVGLQLGSVEIGVLLATLLYGIVTLQAFLYAKKDNTDTLWIRIIVGSVWIIETFHTFCIWWTLYWWTITNYGQREELNTVLWSFATTFAMSATEASIVQSFFAYRVYMFSGRWFVPVVAWAGTIVRFVLGILRVALLVKMKTISRFLASYAWLLTTSMALNATVDIWISCGLCYCLFRVRPMLQDTRKIVDQLLMYTIEIGLLTSTKIASSWPSISYIPN